MDVEEFAAAMVRFENGASLILEVSWMLHHDTKTEDMQMWLYGTQGGLNWPANKIMKSNNDTKRVFDIELGKAPNGMEAHAYECVKFAEAIAEGKPSPVPAENSRDVQTILNGLYESADAGREVRFD